MEFKTDCRYYVGDKPCIYNRLCEDCHHYSPMGTKVLILKLAAIGDVLRTTPILRALRREYSPCHITWVAEESSLELLSYVPLIDRTVALGSPEAARLQWEAFDLCLSLDKHVASTVLAMEVLAREKRGFGFSRAGGLIPLNPEAAYAVALGMSDRLKFEENTKSYQEIMFGACKLPYRGEEYVFEIPAGDLQRAAAHFRAWGADGSRPLVGLFTGSGDGFVHKEWTVEGYSRLITQIEEKTGSKCLLLGGPDDEHRNQEILKRVEAPAIDGGCDNTLAQFASLIDGCHVVVSGDTLAMHLAIARGKRVVALFGPTCPQEIDLYGRGEKVVSPIECAPCYRDTCEVEVHCQELIAPDDVFQAVRRSLASLP